MLSNVLQNYMTILYNFGNQNLINLSIKDNNPLKYHPYYFYGMLRTHYLRQIDPALSTNSVVSISKNSHVIAKIPFAIISHCYLCIYMNYSHIKVTKTNIS